MEHLYISDLDKTLLRTDLSISEFTKQTWNTLVDRGIKLTIATARSGVKSLELLQELKLQHPMIVMDGAMIISPEGRIISSYALDKEQTEKIIEIGKSHRVVPLIVGVDDKDIERFRYASDINELQQQLINEYKTDKRLQYQRTLTPLKDNIKTFFIGDKEPLEELKEEISETFGESIEIKFSKDPYIDGYFLTLLHPKGDKAHAIEELTNIGDYGELNITAFGDSHNDIGMFQKATTKVCVANAIDELKELATDILPYTNDEDAVATYLASKYS